MRFQFSIENTENEIFIVFILWLFPVFIFTENVFRNSTKHIFITVFYLSGNENKKQPNQTAPY